MKVIREPSIYLVGRQTVDEKELKRFLDDQEAGGWTTDTNVAGEKLVEVAGRICYDSFNAPRPGGNAAYTGHILEVGHGSVLEHAAYSFIITGVSRSFSHELVRHRVGFGYSQLSQRYVDESECSFVMPPAIEGDGELEREWEYDIKNSLKAYRALSTRLYDKYRHIKDKTTRRKKAREAARSVLPNCTETRIFVTGNARACRHLIEMRANPAADAEIRKVAVALLRVLQVESPNLFGDYVIEAHPTAGEAATTPFKKV